MGDGALSFPSATRHDAGGVSAGWIQGSGSLCALVAKRG